MARCSRIAELRSNCAERSRGSEVHKAEARAPSGLLPRAPDGDEVSVGTRPRECSDQVIARDFLGKAGPPSPLSL